MFPARCVYLITHGMNSFNRIEVERYKHASMWICNVKTGGPLEISFATGSDAWVK